MIYKATFKSGAHQLFEMDEESAHELGDDLRSYRDFWNKAAAGYTPMPGTNPPSGIFLTDTGAVIDLAELVGFQWYIPVEYAENRANEENMR